MTLKWPLFCVISPNSVSVGAHCVKVYAMVEDRRKKVKSLSCLLMSFLYKRSPKNDDVFADFHSLAVMRSSDRLFSCHHNNPSAMTVSHFLCPFNISFAYARLWAKMTSRRGSMLK